MEVAKRLVHFVAFLLLQVACFGAIVAGLLFVGGLNSHRPALWRLILNAPLVAGFASAAPLLGALLVWPVTDRYSDRVLEHLRGLSSLVASVTALMFFRSVMAIVLVAGALLRGTAPYAESHQLPASLLGLVATAPFVVWYGSRLSKGLARETIVVTARVGLVGSALLMGFAFVLGIDPDPAKPNRWATAAGLEYSLGTFYFTASLSAWMWLGWHRRVRERRMHGHCRVCEYDMRGVPDANRCPECGAPWTSQQAAPERTASPADGVV